jgi:hypothetical protein
MREKKTPKRATKQPLESKYKAVPIKHVFPEGLRSAFSNHITVQHSNEGEFAISFFDVQQPLVLGDPENQSKQWAEIEAAEATCIARIVISATRMPRLIGALISNFEIFERDTGRTAGDDPEDKADQKNAS